MVLGRCEQLYGGLENSRPYLIHPFQVRQHYHIRRESRPSQGCRSCRQGDGEPEEEGELP